MAKAATGKAARAGRAPAARDERTEQRILEAAHGVFVRRGTAGARMQEMAQEAGVNQALLHYYFRSKDRLAEAVFRRAAAELLPRVIAVLGSDAVIEEKVARVVELELDHLLRAPFLPGYLISELHHHPERVPQLISAITGLSPGDIASKVFGKLRAQIAERVDAGTMRPITPDQFVVNLLALCVFPFAARPMLMALLGIDQKGFERFIERRRTELSPFFLKALRP
ncbi:MAG: TetR family transcriptional regulator [Vicinamibacterales bacterium]